MKEARSNAKEMLMYESGELRSSTFAERPKGSSRSWVDVIIM